MKAKEFKTRTIYEETPMASKDGEWVIGLDIGYSSVKGVSANSVYCFPAYARAIPKDRESFKMKANSSDIMYRDMLGNVWVVGDLAYDEASDSEVIDSESELYGANRFHSQMFKVITSVGLAMGMRTNSFGSPEDRKIVVQTGLPPKFMKQFEKILKKAITAHYEFEMKVGAEDWKKYTFDVTEDNVYVMAQPQGALLSVSVDKNGKPLESARVYFDSNVLVFDPGFGTVDTFTVRKGTVTNTETFVNLGMCEVLKRTCDDIFTQYGNEVSVPQLQACLETGEIEITNPDDPMESYPIDFTELLNANCRAVCEEVIEKMKSVHNYFTGIQYIIATGGTYEAWKLMFNAIFEKKKGLTIVSANVNEPSLSNIFSNVRGYYYFRANQ